MPLGYQFSPDEEKRARQGVNNGGAAQGQRGGIGPAGNEAIKILSLRLPNVLGGKPIAPDALLRPGVGGTGSGPGAVGSSVMNTMGGGASPTLPPPTGAGSGLGGNLSSPGGSPFAMSSPAGGGNEGAALASLISNSLGNGPGTPNFKPVLDDPNRPIQIGPDPGGDAAPPNAGTLPLPRDPSGPQGDPLPSAPPSSGGNNDLANWLFGNRSGGGRDRSY